MISTVFYVDGAFEVVQRGRPCLETTTMPAMQNLLSQYLIELNLSNVHQEFQP